MSGSSSSVHFHPLSSLSSRNQPKHPFVPPQKNLNRRTAAAAGALPQRAIPDHLSSSRTVYSLAFPDGKPLVTVILEPYTTPVGEFKDTLSLFSPERQEAITKIISAIMEMAHSNPRASHDLSIMIKNSLNKVGEELDPNFVDNEGLKNIAIRRCRLSDALAGIEATIAKINPILNRASNAFNPPLRHKINQKLKDLEARKIIIEKKITHLEHKLSSNLSTRCRRCARSTFDLRKADPTVRMLLCGRCQKVRYCSSQCQKDDWKRHRKHCKQNNAAKSEKSEKTESQRASKEAKEAKA